MMNKKEMQAMSDLFWKIFKAGFIVICPCFAANMYGQVNTPAPFAGRFYEYIQQYPQEKIYIHTDKNTYLAGETIWYKIYLLEAVNNKPETFSNIVHAELADNNGKIILHAKILTDSGNGKGYFTLPPKLPSGNYLLRAYTNWMKNDDAHFFYKQIITVINTLAAAQVESSINSDPVIARFFPEGGNLVNGMASKIAFEIVDEKGKPLDGTGVVINDKNDTVASFSTLKFGMGSFNFTPVQGNNYKAIIKTKDKLITTSLPRAFNEGYVIHVSDKIETVAINLKAAGKMANMPVYLAVHNQRKFSAIFSEAAPGNDDLTFQIDKATLFDGVSYFTLFNQNGSPVCERLFFKYPDKQLEIKATELKREYGNRDKINIGIDFSESFQKETIADLSLSVFLIDSFQQIPAENIGTCLLLTSALNGHINNPAYFLNQNDSIAKQSLDNLLLTRGWSRYKWESSSQVKENSNLLLPELYGNILSAKVVDKKNGNPASGVNASLAIPGVKFTYLTTVSDSKGICSFNITPLYGRNEAVLQTEAPYRIEVIPSPADKIKNDYVTGYTVCDTCTEQLLNRSIAMQVENSFHINAKNKLKVIQRFDTTVFYGTPDKTYNLDDYTRFLTMEEVMNEYVKEVAVRKQSGNYTFKVKNPAFSAYFDNEPLVLLDGLPVLNNKLIMEMNPLKFKAIDIITSKYYHGTSINEGIVSYRTYDGDLGGYELGLDAVVFEYEGVQQQREFYTPVYETAEQIKDHMPDLRTTLFWEPDIKITAGTKKNLSFYTSDFSGTYLINIQGISKDGKPLHFITPVKVGGK